MIHRIVQFALRQKPIVLLLVAFMAVGGAMAFHNMPVDAYPDLSPPMVEVITQWPGHDALEVERLVTVPTEVEMNGVPKLTVMRSISLYGLSDVIMTFDESTDDYFAREVVFQRLSEVTYPQGVTPTLAPLASPSGLVYRYVIESPDRTPQELKTIEDWVLERQYKQVPGVADDSGFGGTVMQYQVLLDPARALRVSHDRADGHTAALGEQLECGWRILRAGTAVRLRNRRGPGARHLGYRQYRGGLAERGADAHRGHRTGGDRERTAAGRVRLQQDG